MLRDYEWETHIVNTYRLKNAEGEVFYVGATTSTLSSRLCNHKAQATSNKTEKDKYILERNYDISIESVAVAHILALSPNHAIKQNWSNEAYWIEYYELRKVPIFNVVGHKARSKASKLKKFGKC